MTRDEELWGVALWVERMHGSEGPAHIEAQIARLASCGELAGVKMWRSVGQRFDQLSRRTGLQ